MVGEGFAICQPLFFKKIISYITTLKQKKIHSISPLQRKVLTY